VSVGGAVFETMIFLRQACAGIVLVMLTLGLQSAGMAALIEWAKTHFARGVQALGSWGSAVLMVRFTSLLVCLHILEILLWAVFYRWRCLTTWESALYFSATSYSTVGYGDVVLQPVWRILGPVESVAGVLMCGLSASFLFAVVTRLVENNESGESHR
jgi:voltage-gated potassium channel